MNEGGVANPKTSDDDSSCRSFLLELRENIGFFLIDPSLLGSHYLQGHENWRTIIFLRSYAGT